MPVSGTEAPSSENQGASEEAQHKKQIPSNNQVKAKNQQNQQEQKEKQQQLSHHSRARLKNAQRDPKEEARAEEEKKKRPLRLLGGLDLGKKSAAPQAAPLEETSPPARPHLTLVENPETAKEDTVPLDTGRATGSDSGSFGLQSSSQSRPQAPNRPEPPSSPNSEGGFMDLLTAFQHQNSALEKEKGKKIYLDTSQKLRRVGKTQKGVIVDTLAG